MNASVSMTPERWQRLQMLFDEALSFEPHSRADFIVNACGDDMSLREQLLSLVMASAGMDRFEEQVDRAIAATMSDGAELPPGSIVGRYKIVRLLGRGGMGAVYLAERADREFEHRVALKIVAAGALSSRIVGRLRSERQILANLNHPQIARLLDGGATTEGTPYLVMEYVDGRRIDRYCEEERLDVTARLRRFQQVCAAVQYAHQNLVVHRDIKPSNILVTEQGLPKLLDFGIAKLVDPNATAESMALTRIHERVLTPEHASPEQVRGATIGTVSDVYALGVLLYELLTGLKPYNFNGMSFEQIEKAICEETPLKPSAAVIAASKLEVVTADAALAKSLQGDLDTIVMKAMHKEPERRYATAGALADDIERFLSDRPIVARPDSFGYRTQKFLRRNRLTVASAAGVLVIIVALTIFYAWRLVAARDVAERERLTAQRVSEFMTAVFRVANPSESRGNTVPAREVLDAAVKRIDRDLHDEPRVRVELLQKMAQSYVGLGLWGSASLLLKQAAEQARMTFGERSAELANALTALAAVQQRQANYAEERKSLEESLAIRRDLGADRDRATVMTLVAWARNQAVRGESESALRSLKEAEDIVGKWARPEPAVLGEVLASYGRVYHDVSKYKESEGFLRKALPLLRGAVEQGADRYADASLLLIEDLIWQSRLSEAIPLSAGIVKEFEKIFGPEHPLVAEAWDLLGIAHCESGEYEECSVGFRNAVLVESKQSADGSVRLAVRYHNLGSAYRDAGNPTAALEALDRAGELFRKLRGEKDPNLMNVYYEKAAAYREIGRLDAAEKSLRAAEGIAGETGDRQNPVLSYVAVERGRLLIAKSSFAQAADHLRAALPRIAPEEKRLQASAHLALGQALLALGRCDVAARELQTAYDIRRERMPPQNWFIYEAQNNLGNALSVCGNYVEAEPMLTASVERLRRLRHSGDLRLADAERNLAAHRARVATRASTTP